jgi:hypothetical protein
MWRSHSSAVPGNSGYGAHSRISFELREDDADSSRGFGRTSSAARSAFATPGSTNQDEAFRVWKVSVGPNSGG